MQRYSFVTSNVINYSLDFVKDFVDISFMRDLDVFDYLLASLGSLKDFKWLLFEV